MSQFLVNCARNGQSWEMLKEEFGVFGDIIKVSKVFVQ